MDESEFVSEQLWLNTIWPLYMQKKTSVLAATSPQGSNSYNNYLLGLKNPTTGKNIFNVVLLKEICKACRGTDKAWKCEHKSTAMSGNKSAAKRKDTLSFYRSNQKHIAMRELYGKASDGNGGLIPERLIKRLKESSVPIDKPARAVYIGVDPGGGGDGKTGLCAIVETLTDRGAKLAVCLVSLA